ncbi:MAG: S-methyl-5-thioribose-1-phosphate isomerase [Planctomycetes bacterium]|nr:S-methyl-5-thioribose-1-phosphate isomerase [Planctomycetota bacterium]
MMQRSIRTIEWVGGVDGFARLIDQTLLPTELRYVECRDVETLWEAIRSLRVRGAPAIGIAGAMGLVLGVRGSAAHSFADFYADLKRSSDYLRTSRPTAVNLFWALDRMEHVAESQRHLPVPQLIERLRVEALAIEEEDRQMCRAIGRIGAELIRDGDGVLTHCNAGGLATADYGTALAVLFAAHEQSKSLHVFVDETRPLLQGARLTAWELVQRDIPATLICDNMAAQVMREGRVRLVITGADRIAANGDTANKIGTYGLAVLASAHGIPFYVAAPSSTFDLSIPTGESIPIEQRDPREVTHGFGRQTAPENVGVYNPAFDVTPARLIQSIITDKGLIRPVNETNIRQTLGR